jgi:hypothetical protein
LALNGIAADMILPFLDAADNSPAPVLSPVVLSAPVTPEEIAALMVGGLPALAHVVERTLDLARFELSPDPVRFPRAFTLHDDGTGRPFVSCPLDGTEGDLLRLAHEIGHACQIVGVGTGLPGPVLRETAAYVAETLVVAGLRAADDRVADALAARHARDTRDIARRHGAGLLAAIGDPATDREYRYGWNYPVARRVALEVTARWPDDAVAALFTAPPPLAEVLTLALPQAGRAS